MIFEAHTQFVYLLFEVCILTFRSNPVHPNEILTVVHTQLMREKDATKYLFVPFTIKWAKSFLKKKKLKYMIVHTCQAAGMRKRSAQNTRAKLCLFYRALNSFEQIKITKLSDEANNAT